MATVYEAPSCALPCPTSSTDTNPGLVHLLIVYLIHSTAHTIPSMLLKAEINCTMKVVYTISSMLNVLNMLNKLSSGSPSLLRL